MSSLVLFTLYTDACRSFYINNHIIKFSDDTAILSLLKRNHDISDYFLEIQGFVEWCDNNHLILNVNKKEEMVFDPRGAFDHKPVVIHNQAMWSTHIDSLCCRLQQQLYYLRRLRIHGVDQRLMLIFYKAVLESLLRCSITAWFGNLSVQLKNKLSQFMLLEKLLSVQSEYL